MLQKRRRPQSATDVGIAHTAIAAFSVIALSCAAVAVGVAVYKDGDAKVVASAEAGASTPGKKIDFGAEPGTAWQPFDPTLQPAPGGTEHAITIHAAETRSRSRPG